MNVLKKLFNGFVYHNTEKPEHYVHIDKPRSLQDLRQIQYNNWCKANGVYNGSYLPSNPDKLKESSKKGWREITSPKDNTRLHRTFQRKSSGQVVDYHDKAPTKKGTIADEHYHWENPNPTLFNSKKETKYLDRYGNGCISGSRESHLAPLNKNYNYK